MPIGTLQQVSLAVIFPRVRTVAIYVLSERVMEDRIHSPRSVQKCTESENEALAKLVFLE